MINIDFKRQVPRLLAATPFRLFTIYVSLFCSAVAITFIYVYLNLQTFLANDVESAIMADMQTLQERLQSHGEQALIDTLNDRTSSSRHALYLLANMDGAKLAGNLDSISPELWNSLGRVSFSYRKSTDGASSARNRPAYGVVMRLPHGLRMIVGRDIQDQEDVKHLMRRAFLLGYGVITLIGLFGGILVSRHLLARVDAASNTAHAIMNGNLAKRIPLSGRNDEFERLSANLNAMLDRIQHLMVGLKEVSDNIAHDLKTPLHRLRTRAERALQTHKSAEDLAEALGAIIEEADGLIQTFDALLNIARLEAGSRAETFGPVDLCTVVGDVVELYEPASEEAGLALHFQCPGSVLMAGEKHLLGQALANLLDNAIKYANTEEEGHNTSLDVRIENHGEECHLIVADHGPGIPEKDRERVLQRFVRLQPSRSIPGSGLGLSLVSAVARLHGGSLALEDNMPGLRVRIRLKKNLAAAADYALSVPA